MEKTQEKITEKQPRKRTKGPKTVIKEDLVSFKGDLLDTPTDQQPEVIDVFDPKEKAKSLDDIVVERYNPDVDKGLLTDEVESRMIAGMVNMSETGSSKTIPGIIFKNIVTFFNILNFAIAGWLISVGASFLNVFFIIIVSTNIAIGIFQEIRAKKIIDKLSLLSAPTAVVMRNQEELEIMVSQVVIDDILLLSSGKQIPADAVVRTGRVEVNESLLTGESDAVIKKEGDPLYSGSYIISGRAYAQVSAVGKDIYIEKLTNQAKKYRKPKSDLLGSLKTIITIVGFLIIPIAVVLFYLMSQNEANTYEVIVKATAGAMIGMIPSGLFLLTSMALAVGVIRLAQNNTLVQELYCIEMLARVDTLCLDKTGTITDGTMSVKSVIELENNTGLTLKNIISASLNTQNDWNLTSKALQERFGTGKRIRSKTQIAFSSSRKFSAVSFEKYGTFVIGAPEFAVKKHYDLIETEVDKQARLGYRVIVVGFHEGMIDEAGNLPGEMLPLALIMIEDTIRPDAIETIDYFKQNGVEVKVISGDNPLTVSRIASRAGISNATEYISLEGASDKDVVKYANQYTVFGRVSPGQKKLLIESMKNNGKTVAMTGDGVNDILALKEADTSIAMASGSEAARNVSHLVLLDSNFSSMPKVVSEGRRVINNVQKVSTLFLTKTIFSFLLAIMAIIRQGNYPIQPNQLVLIDFFVIGIPSFFLALEPNNGQVKGKFLVNIVKAALPGALVVMINTLIIFLLAEPLEMDYRTTSTLIVISAIVTSFTVLFRVSMPFNKLRTILFVTMASSVVLLVLFVPYAFEFSPLYEMRIMAGIKPLTTSQIILLVALGQASYTLMYIISNLYGWIKKTIRNVLNKVADLQ